LDIHPLVVPFFLVKGNSRRTAAPVESKAKELCPEAHQTHPPPVDSHRFRRLPRPVSDRIGLAGRATGVVAPAPSGESSTDQHPPFRGQLVPPI